MGEKASNEKAMPSPSDERYAIRIGRDGTWYYHDTPIRRPELVKLFASVLRRDEAGDYWLITPAERGRITVEDAPFLAVELTADGDGENQELRFRTNIDEVVAAGPDHPIRVDVEPGSGEPRPYIQVRDGIEARIARPVFYELVDRAQQREFQGQTRMGVWSRGTFFVLGSLLET